jgi:SNF2 family DNA or RNA helicase
VLVVTPASVLSQWVREIERFSNLVVREYHGKDRGRFLEMASGQRLEVLLTSYDTFRGNFVDLNAIEWNAIIFDEIHKIKNKQSKLTQAVTQLQNRHRYGLTGTVMQNSFIELWTLVDFVNPNYLGSLENFRKYFINPIKNGQRHNALEIHIAQGRICSKKLAQRLKMIILRRDKKLIADLVGPALTPSFPARKTTLFFASCPRYRPRSTIDCLRPPSLFS